MTEYTQPEMISESISFASVDDIPSLRFRGFDGVSAEVVLDSYWDDEESYRWDLDTNVVEFGSKQCIELSVSSSAVSPGKYYLQANVDIPEYGSFVQPSPPQKVFVLEGHL